MHLTMGSKTTDTEGRIREVARHLTQFPADLVMDAIQALQKEEEWFPALSKFIARITPRYERRQRIRREIERECGHWASAAE